MTMVVKRRSILSQVVQGRRWSITASAFVRLSMVVLWPAGRMRVEWIRRCTARPLGIVYFL